ncbi:MAG: lysylphosphatidylglycerol synthase transmembrane domain-containing protein [Halobacteriota archaeon]
MVSLLGSRHHSSRTLLGFVAAGAVVAAIFLLADAGEVHNAVARADLRLVAAVGGLVLLWNVCWGLGLWNVLRSLGVEMAPPGAVLIHAVAAFADNVTPFGQLGGEPVSAWLIAKRADVDYEVGFASITGLDAVNAVPSLTLAGVGLTYVLRFHAPGAALVAALRVAAVAIVVLPVLLLGVWRYRNVLTPRLVGILVGIARLSNRFVDRVDPPTRPAIRARLRGYVGALETIGANRYRLVAALGWSSAGWLCQMLALWVAFRAVGAPIPVYVPLLIIPVGRVAAAVPTPGGLGGIEAVYVGLIVLITTVPAGAAAVAVTLHSVGGYLLTVSVGASVGSALGLGASAR